RAIERVGGARRIDIDVRILAATHRDLAAEARDGRFRADLYYRLGGFPIEVPPLRDRGFDVHLLADHFLERVSLGNGRPIRGFSSAARKKLLHDRWSGNVRELEHAIERAALLCGGDVIDASDLEL